ncbi:MAG: lysylphosphatidylglycerol synthase transmembrane domain-containing protein [Chloroflexales bacterium]
MHTHRIPWSLIIGALLLMAVVALGIHNWPTIHDATRLMQHARPGWLMLGVLAVALGFVCAGQIYGRVLGILGFRLPQLWLISAAMVSILISQTIPAGTVASYAFLTSSLRRRGIPATSVALLASLELFTWIGGMLVLFCFGLIYKIVFLGDNSTSQITYPAAMLALAVVGAIAFASTRPRPTLHRWVTLLGRVAGRIVRRSWSEAHIHQIVDELDTNRRLIMERPRQAVVLLCLQLFVFFLHSMALLMLIHALGSTAPPLAVLAAYGLALIVSTFTALPGGGGTVEAALTLSLTAEGVPPEAALGATILFRLCSFWLLLPLGAICYRLLTTSNDQRLQSDQ